MFDQLDKFGLPIKYAIVGFFAGILGAVPGHILGLFDNPATAWSTPIATAVGGAIGGFIREKRGFKS